MSQVPLFGHLQIINLCNSMLFSASMPKDCRFEVTMESCSYFSVAAAQSPGKRLRRCLLSLSLRFLPSKRADISEFYIDFDFSKHIITPPAIMGFRFVDLHDTTFQADFSQALKNPPTGLDSTWHNSNFESLFVGCGDLDYNVGQLRTHIWGERRQPAHLRLCGDGFIHPKGPSSAVETIPVCVLLESPVPFTETLYADCRLVCHVATSRHRSPTGESEQIVSRHIMNDLRMARGPELQVCEGDRTFYRPLGEKEPTVRTRMPQIDAAQTDASKVRARAGVVRFEPCRLDTTTQADTLQPHSATSDTAEPLPSSSPLALQKSDDLRLYASSEKPEDSAQVTLASSTPGERIVNDNNKAKLMRSSPNLKGHTKAHTKAPSCSSTSSLYLPLRRLNSLRPTIAAGASRTTTVVPPPSSTRFPSQIITVIPATPVTASELLLPASRTIQQTVLSVPTPSTPSLARPTFDLMQSVDRWGKCRDAVHHFATEMTSLNEKNAFENGPIRLYHMMRTHWRLEDLAIHDVTWEDVAAYFEYLWSLKTNFKEVGEGVHMSKPRDRMSAKRKARAITKDTASPTPAIPPNGFATPIHIATSAPIPSTKPNTTLDSDNQMQPRRKGLRRRTQVLNIAAALPAQSPSHIDPHMDALATKSEPEAVPPASARRPTRQAMPGSQLEVLSSVLSTGILTTGQSGSPESLALRARSDKSWSLQEAHLR